MNRVVARFRDGRVLKGHTANFVASADIFHIARLETPASPPEPVNLVELKALFFVKDFAGNPMHDERKFFETWRVSGGQRVMVEFVDGEVLVGNAQPPEPDVPGFFLIPADGSSNIERCFVLTAATAQIRTL